MKMPNIPELGFWEIAALIGALMLLGQLLRFLWRKCRRMKALYDMARYESARADYYAAAPASAPPPSAPRGQRTQPDPEFYKDEDTRIHSMAEPKGFWSQLIMGEKMNLIREMIRISNSDEHKGYWQDRALAQKRVEGQRQVGEEGQGR